MALTLQACANQADDCHKMLTCGHYGEPDAGQGGSSASSLGSSSGDSSWHFECVRVTTKLEGTGPRSDSDQDN